LFITSTTPLNLTWEDGTGTGVNTVSYMYYAFGETEPAYSQYLSDFTISTSKPDGLIFVKFKSTDKLGNEETQQLEQVFLDNTPPMTNIGIGTPSHTDAGMTYVTSSSQVTLTSDDGSGSGISEVMYGIDDPSCPDTYTTAFFLSSVTEGAHVVYYRAEDNLGNEELVKSVNMYLDETAPVSTAIFADPKHLDSSITYVNDNTDITFSTDDGAGSGTASTWYRVLKNGMPEIQWTEYTGAPFTLSGTDGLRQIVFRSTDNLGNEEPDRTMDVYLDTASPTSSIPGHDAGVTVYFNNTLASIEMTATDGDGSGVGETRYGVDDPNCPNTYSGPIIVGILTEGRHLIYFKSIDNVDNEETIKNITVFVDVTSPVADAGDDLQVETGEIFTLDGGPSTDGTGGSGMKSFTWSFFFKGSPITSNNEIGEFMIEEEGSYEFTLVVTDHAGNTDSDTVTVKVVSKADAGFPWWILALLVVVVVSMLLVFALFKRKKKPKDEEEERECEECGHVLGPHDRVCPECDAVIATAPRR
jgi:hypothetical protein